MAELNKLNCAKKIRNTGYSGCPVDFLAFIGGFLVPSDKVFKKSELADLRATLQAAVLAAPGQRIYPFHGWEGTTPNTQDPTFAAMPSGRQVFVQEGDIDVTYQFIDGGQCLLNRLRSFNNNTNFALLRYDKNFVIQGTSKLDEDGNPGLAGIPLKVLFAYSANENDHTNPTVYRMRFAFAPHYVNENLAYVQADFPLTEIKGLVDINLEISGTPTGGVYEVLAMAGCGGGVNLYDQYSTQLAAVGLWKVYNDANGNEITLTSVAANPGLKSFKLTADTADPDYTAATATGKIRIETDTPVALDTADISGFEGVPVTVVRGA